MSSPAAERTRPGRRTQHERRSETIGRVLAATVDLLCEKGYAGTSVNAVAARSGVSVGGIFRHFPTRQDLMVAAADEVRRRQFEDFGAGLRALGDESVEHCLRLLRIACRAPMNTAWYELLIAARTDADLRERLRPFTERYHRQITGLARTLPLAAVVPADVLDTVVLTVVHLLDGESLWSIVHPTPEQDELRLHLVASLLRGGTALGGIC